MTTVSVVIKGNVDPNNTLRETWDDMVVQLREAGTDEDQIHSMEMTFFMGAAQTFTSIDKAAGKGLPALATAMRLIFQDVDEHMKTHMHILRTEGNA